MQELPPGFQLDSQPQSGPRIIRGAPAQTTPAENARIGLQARSVALQERKEEREDAKLRLTPAQEAVDKEFAKEYVSWQATGGFADFQKQIGQLDSALENLESSDSITGWFVGNLPDTINSMIGNEGAIATREAVEEVVQRNLRLILGAQFTNEEGKRLIARAYNPRLSEQENATRLKRLIKQMRTAAQTKADAARYFEENGTLSGWRGQLPTFSDFDPERDMETAVRQSTDEDDALIRKYLD